MEKLRPVNKQLTPRAKMLREQRKAGARKSDDPEGVMATLQVAKRLVGENPGLHPVSALERAADIYAAPVDSVRAFWAAHYALSMANTEGLQDRTNADAWLLIFDKAIAAQARINGTKE